MAVNGFPLIAIQRRRPDDGFANLTMTAGPTFSSPNGHVYPRVDTIKEGSLLVRSVSESPPFPTIVLSSLLATPRIHGKANATHPKPGKGELPVHLAVVLKSVQF
jgi:hypothetical protein